MTCSQFTEDSKIKTFSSSFCRLKKNVDIAYFLHLIIWLNWTELNWRSFGSSKYSNRNLRQKKILHRAAPSSAFCFWRFWYIFDYIWYFYRLRCIIHVQNLNFRYKLNGNLETQNTNTQCCCWKSFPNFKKINSTYSLNLIVSEFNFLRIFQYLWYNGNFNFIT